MRAALLFSAVAIIVVAVDPFATFCDWCHTSIPMIFTAIRLGIVGKHDAAVVAEDECSKRLNIGSICSKAVRNLTPYFIDFINNSKLDLDSASELCPMLLPPCSKSPRLYSWNLGLPKKLKKVNTYRQHGRTLRVLQLTDIHVDPFYAAGSAIKCLPSSHPLANLLICCRGVSAEDTSNAAGYWGTTRGQCDLPHRTFESALRYISRYQKFDYILLTGDFQPHDMWEYTKERSIWFMRNVTRTIEQFFPDTKLYLTLGNHEAVPFDAFSYTDNQESPQKWLYREMERIIGEKTPSENRKELLSHGSYVAFPAPGLKIINLNNNFCYYNNFFYHQQPVDPAGVLAFLIRELEAAEKLEQVVHIHAHIPPTKNDCFPDWTRNYLNILERFRETIAEQFFGHNHIEEHLVFEDKKGEPMATGWVAPSMSTWEHVNPAFRTYVLSGENYKVLASSVFHAAVDDVPPTKEPQWIEVNTGVELGLQSFSPSNWKHLIHQLKSNETARSAYVASTYRYTKWTTNCDDTCASRLIEKSIIERND